MRKPNLVPLSQLPTWTYVGLPRDLYTLAAALTLAGLENQWIRLSARTQRAVIGRPFFGKRRFGLFGGQFRTVRVVCFGLDYETRDVTPRVFESYSVLP